MLVALLIVVALSGCASRVTWRPPAAAGFTWPYPSAEPNFDSKLRERFNSGLALEREGNASCVDHYFSVALATAQASQPRGSELHRKSLQRIVIAGQRFGRLDPQRGLAIGDGVRQECIPIDHIGFVWSKEEFEQLDVVGDYSTNAVRCLHQIPGIGIPLVVSHDNPLNRRFCEETCGFSATLTLESGDGPRFVMYDPKRVSRDSFSRPIYRDLSAAYAYLLREQQSSLLEKFITDPVSPSGQSKLTFVEPYQPGKIPVVLVHGLLSNPFTWMQTLTDLESQSWYVENYQTLVFRYPTGREFLVSAADFRAQLAEARAISDPTGQDLAFEQGILVGHSLGGLLSKLLVTNSGDQLWRSIANRSVDEVDFPNQMEFNVYRSFFFRPSPEISRVVFIGTPHEGAVTANRLIGRVGSALVQSPEEALAAHRQLIACNPDTFAPEVRDRIPTSIDLLEPDSRLLKAIQRLPVAAGVSIHSIVGDSSWGPLAGRSDGVVPVSSARGVPALSERFIDEKHTKLHMHAEARDELFRILRLHLEGGSGPRSIGSVPEGSVPVEASKLNWTVFRPAWELDESQPSESSQRAIDARLTSK